MQYDMLCENVQVRFFVTTLRDRDFALCTEKIVKFMVKLEKYRERC